MVILVRSPAPALDGFYKPSVFFMFLRDDFTVDSVLLSFCAECITYIEL